MAFTADQLAALNAVYDAIPAEVRQILENSSTSDTATAIVSIVAQRRQAGMAAAMANLFTIQVADWAAADQAAALADGATMSPALRSAYTAWQAHDAGALGPAVAAFLVAAFKYYELAEQQA